MDKHSIVELAKSLFNIDVVALPIDDLPERISILENLLDQAKVKELSQRVSKIINQFKSQIEDQEYTVPYFIKLEFEEQWNDGDATYPTISGIYLYDKEGKRSDADEACVDDEEYTGELGELLSEILNDAYDIRDLECTVGYTKIALTIEGDETNVSY